VPSTDVIPYIDGAHALLSHGRLPDRGVVTSFSSFAPPGLAWVVLPGAFLFSDPRVLDVPGNAILHLGTLFGIFLLARACFGARCALLSVLLYGVSEHGLTFAGSFGPRGHPFFYVWMAYWTCWWVARRDARYLAAALVTWLTGMYAFMEIAPALFILPVVWVFYRPPVHIRALAVAGAIGLVMWFPYLRFEATRRFSDVRSQVLLQNIAPATYADALCDPRLTLRQWESSSTEPLPAGNLQFTSRTTRLLMRPGRRALAMVSGLFVNFRGLIPGTDVVLLAMTMAGLLLVTIGRRSVPPEERGTGVRVDTFPSWLATTLAISLLVCAGLVNEVVIGRVLGPGVALGPFAVSMIRALQATLLLGGLAIVMRRSIARSLRTLASQITTAPCDPVVLIVALVVPWAVLLLIAESGRSDRFVGLWPLQVIVLAFASSVKKGSGDSRPLLGPVLVTGAILANPFLLSRAHAWVQDGWPGADAVEIRVAEYLAGQLRAGGQNRAAIGYRLFVEGPPQPLMPAIDDRWRLGEEFDVILEYRHGIANLDTCGEGLSPQDEYRIVEAHPPTPNGTHYYFDVPPAGPLRLLDRIANYEIYKTDRSR
jgi:hypothetical protein